MSFTLSVTRTPVNGAAFGTSRTLGPLPTTAAVARETAWLLAGSPFNVPTDEAKRYALSLARKDHGTEHTHTGTGLVFRTDPADQAPHPCPCCSRLVLPTDHAYATEEDAYCLGCFTWDRNVSACLPANSAHPVTATER